MAIMNGLYTPCRSIFCSNNTFMFGSKKEKKPAPSSKLSVISSTTGTDEQEDCPSPKRQYEDYLIATNKLHSELAFKKSARKDDYRASFAYSDGGIRCEDEAQVDKLRSVGKEVIKIIGRKILSGEFNLTKVSFPVRACHPKTALYNSIASCTTFPYFMNQAAHEKHPLERFKLVVACFLSSSYYLNMFLKPLNPIIGQTLQATLVDGTHIYAEQVSHHPPISYFLVVGPKDSYRFSGMYDFDISPGLNSLTMRNKGKRKVQFPDGGVIEGTYPSNEFSATFIGTTRIEELGECTFTDPKNHLSCKIAFNSVKKHPSDYFESVIVHKEQAVCKVFGTYCGYLQFDGQRYWDGRDIQPLHIELSRNINLLPSDWSYRKDIQDLIYRPNDMDHAQKSKEDLEQLQRNDAKLRKTWEQLREKEEEKRKEEDKHREKEKESLKKKKKKKISIQRPKSQMSGMEGQ